MRLINTKSLELKEFLGDPTNPRFPRYAILSHTWEEEEVTFQDIQNIDVAKKKAGFAKIAKCSEIALDEGLSWAWVDTCCIDKTSSAELTEAINSMFKWYESSTICYAYLSDIIRNTKSDAESGSGVAKCCDWRESKWFTRGWTLQELIAPFEVIVYDGEWKQLGTKRLLAKELEKKTGIPEAVLLDPSVRRKKSIAARMLWAKGRQTTRIEDTAYSLLGLFDISNMPLVYGEGKKSLLRLHQNIMNTHQDDTIFLGGLAYQDQELGKLRLSDLTAAINKHAFLIAPDNVPAQLPNIVHPLLDVVGSHDMSQLTNRSHLLTSAAGTWERKDPRLRGDVLSMPMRMIQVRFREDGQAIIPITMKKQTKIELDPSSREVLATINTERGYLCLGMLRCSTTDGLILARYFLCAEINNELRAYPTAIYRYVTPTEVRGWPSMPCHILLFEDFWKPYPVLESLRDAASWGLTPPTGGTFSNGWKWNAIMAGNAENTDDPALGIPGEYRHYYRLYFHPTAKTWELAISVRVGKINFMGRGTSDASVEINLHRPLNSKFSIRTVKFEHSGREGPVTELCHRIPVLGGSAELVVSIYYGVDVGTRYYSPMIRFRAFEEGDMEGSQAPKDE
ncbi:heterokaryon incompatibility protein-domain-containing protein [Nemania diffusa]|nr:heterokaryon incompatibility protein-domain-containing protein [Nemania diffusa]